mmetsp:Transcript_8461/g.15477  ORF Transcript_8461/g.15477 Transcript_8461/m.15477 type:complete len:116 (-) Transcript_8461:385-732(-)
MPKPNLKTGRHDIHRGIPLHSYPSWKFSKTLTDFSSTSTGAGFIRSALILLGIVQNQANGTDQLILGLFGSPDKEFRPMMRNFTGGFCSSCLIKFVFRSDALGLMVNMGVWQHVE